jgi:hypothetical protein
MLNNQWVIHEIKEEIKRFRELNKNENTTYQILCVTAKADLRGKFISMSAYIKRTERSQINALILHPPRKTRTSKSQISRRREIIKIRAKINAFFLCFIAHTTSGILTTCYK